MTDYKHEVRDYNNGQIHGWNGGDCPVHPETVVKYWMRSGASYEVKARTPCWSHSLSRSDILSHTLSGSDIIAFQVVKAYVEPARPAALKVIWVNETKGVVYEAYTSEEAARLTVYPSTTRIAVKYVEVKE